MVRNLVNLGVLLLIALLLFIFYPQAYSWFGLLPGDINFRGENMRVFLPLSSLLFLSVVLTLILALVDRVQRGRN